MKKYYVVAAFGVVALLIFLLFGLRNTKPRLNSTPAQTSVGLKPHSFAECADQGYPVEETEPRRCRAGNIFFVDDTTMVDRDPLAVPVELDVIVPHAVVTSPLRVTGKAPGSWFFEANIGLSILDENGVEVARGHAEAVGDWMTTEQVRFAGTIQFTAPSSAAGYIEIQKDNPSDLRELDASIRMPIRFR